LAPKSLSTHPKHRRKSSSPSFVHILFSSKKAGSCKHGWPQLAKLLRNPLPDISCNLVIEFRCIE
jgi:hypothetical protein